MLTESLLLAAMGGTAGLALGYVSRNLIPWLMRTGWDGGELPIGFDWRVFGFTSAATLLTGVLFGLVPAWRSTRAEIGTSLKGGSPHCKQAAQGVVRQGNRRLPGRLSTLLVVAALFFLRTLWNLNSVDPGFQTKNLLLIDVTPPAPPALFLSLRTCTRVSRTPSRPCPAFRTSPMSITL